MWVTDPAVADARKHVAWRDFHCDCGKVGLFFARSERVPGGFKTRAFTLHRTSDGYSSERLAIGFGDTVLQSLQDAYNNSGRSIADTSLFGLALEDMFG